MRNTSLWVCCLTELNLCVCERVIEVMVKYELMWWRTLYTKYIMVQSNILKSESLYLIPLQPRVSPSIFSDFLYFCPHASKARPVRLGNAANFLGSGQNRGSSGWWIPVSRSCWESCRSVPGRHNLSASHHQRLGMNPTSLPHLKGNGDSFTGNSLIIQYGLKLIYFKHPDGIYIEQMLR